MKINLKNIHLTSLEKWIYIAYAVVVVFSLWVWATTTVQGFKCPEMTQTQLFMAIPECFVLDFKECDSK